jgi:hypothetical protein
MKYFFFSYLDQEYRISLNNGTNFEFDLLINSTLRTFRSALKSFLTSQKSNNKHFVNATFDYNLNGDLNLQDSVFSYDDLHHLLHGDLKDDLIAWKQRATLSFNFYMSQKFIDSNRAWKQLEKLNQTPSSSQQQQFKVNAVAVVIKQEQDEFFSLIERYFNLKSVDQLMEESRFTGTLKNPRPSFYVFPSGQGDSAYFSIDGYTMLINGGYSRARPCFWNFVSMLKQIDSVLLTHSDSDTLGGLCSLFAKKANTNTESKTTVLSVLGNLVPSGSSGEQTDSDFILDCVEKLKYKLLPLFKTNDNLIANAALAKQAHNLSKYEHVNLYYKLGQGSLDLYVLSPLQSSPEFKEFCQQQSAHFARNQNLKQIYKNMPSSHLASAVCLLVWLPMHRQVDALIPNQALRLLFTGHAPQNIILHALDKLKDFELLNTPVYKVRQQETGLQPQKKIVHSASSVIKTEASKAADNNKQVQAVKQEPSSSKPPVATKPSTTAATAKPPTAHSKPPTSSASSSAISSSANNNTKAKSGSSAAHDSSFSKKSESTTTVSKSLAHSKATTSSSNVRASISETSATNKSAATSARPAATNSTSNVTKSRQSISGASTTNTTIAAASSVKQKESATSTAKKSVTTTTASSASKPTAATTNSSTTTATKKEGIQAKKTLSLTIDNSKKTSGTTTSSKPAAASKSQTTDVEVAVAPTAADATSAEGQVTEETVVVNSDTVVTTIGIAPEAAATTTESIQDEAVVQQVETTAVTLTKVKVEDAVDQTVEQQNQQIAAETTPEVVESIEDQQVEVKEEVGDDGFVHVNQNDVPEVEQQQQTEIDIELHLENGHHHHSPLSSEALNDDLVCLDANNPQSEVVAPVNGNHNHDSLINQDEEDNLNSIPSSYNHHTNESPNLSPVKKESQLNGDDQNPIVSNINGLLIDVEEQKLIQNNLNHETNGSVSNGVDLEIMSTNLTSKNGDVMTTSFIEDPSNPDSNPFNSVPHVVREPTNQLNDSQDLNRTHELFKDEEEEDGSNGVEKQQNGTSENGHHLNGLERNGHEEEEEAGEMIDERELVQQKNSSNSSFNTDKLIDGIEQMKIAAAQELENHTNGASTATTTNNSEAKSWNLLELPKPVNPSDSKSNLAVAASNGVKKSNSSTPSSPAAASKTPPEIAAKTTPAASTISATTASQKPANIHPTYVELTYIPAHGNSQYVDVDFFKRVRARYYVLSCLEPSEHVLNALLEAKENFWSGEDKNALVNLVPTHETELLRKWFVQNEEKLAKLKIEILPAADMATLTIDDDPDSSCHAYKIEF